MEGSENVGDVGDSGAWVQSHKRVWGRVALFIEEAAALSLSSVQTPVHHVIRHEQAVIVLTVRRHVFHRQFKWTCNQTISRIVNS